MKFEYKVVIMSIVFSILCMFAFTYVSFFDQKTVYVYQVGIYKEEKNKDSKLKELKEDGYEGYFYQKDQQYYVLSKITEKQDDIKEHSQNVKGIIKEYTVSKDMTVEKLLEYLSKGDIND